MIVRVARALRLAPEETRRALLFGGILFALTSSYTLVKTARDALYLARLPATTLPFVYLGVGAIATVVGALLGRITNRGTTWRSLEVGAWVSALALIAFSSLFRLEANWVPILFYLWVNAYGLILFLLFWTFTNSLSHPREAKRIFGIIGVGGILGGVFGGLIAPPLVQQWGLSSLLMAAAALVVLVPSGVRSGLGRRDLARAEPAPDDAGAVAHPLRHRYVRWLALAALCSVLVSTLVAYQFKVELQARYPSPDALASFLGLFYTATNLAALAMQLFVTRWSLQSFGAGWSAAVLPAGLGVGAAVTMIVPGFAAVMATRLWDEIMRTSMNRTAVELFYFPLAPGLRARARALIEAGLERAGDALAGLLILAVGLLMGVDTFALAVLLAVVVVVWVTAWLGVRRGYVAELGRNLRRLNLDSSHSTVSLREASVIEEMTRLLESPYERVVLRGLEMLEETAPEQIQVHLGKLLTHASPSVRARGLAYAASRQAAEVREQLAGLMHDDDPEVRVEALRAYCALGGERRFAMMEEFLESQDPRLRWTALECIATYATPEEEGRAREILERALREGGHEERAAVVEGLGRRPGPSALHALIGPLLRDARLEVRNAALRGAGRAQQRTLVPKLIEALALRESSGVAREGLAAFGDRVVGTLGDYLCDGGVAIEVRREIPRVLSIVASQEAVNALFRCRERDDVRLSYRILKAANRIRSLNSAVEFPRSLVTEDLHYDARSHLFALVHYRACPIGEVGSAERLLCVALNERMDQALNRVFRRLGLVYPSREILLAYRGVGSEDPRVRGNAIEYLESALAPDHRALLLWLVDDSGDETRLRMAETRFGMRYVGYTETLDEILQGPDPWLKTCALYVVGKRRELALAQSVESNLASLVPHVRETAAWARSALGFAS